MPGKASDDTRTGPRPAGSPSAGAVSVGAVLGATVVVALATGWFVLSWRVGHNGIGNAFGEALGVGLGLLILASVVGAVRSRDPTGADDSDDD